MHLLVLWVTLSPHGCSLGLACELSDYSNFIQGSWLSLAPRHLSGSCKSSYDPASGVTVLFPLCSIGYKLVTGSAQIQGQGATSGMNTGTLGSLRAII